MHPRNRYGSPHDFTALASLEPRLRPYLITRPDGHTSLDFSQAAAVYLLNRTLLRRDYGLRHWDLPPDNLIPPVPGRLDYVHALHDLNSDTRRVLDVGTGASLIYPILGAGEYGWRFVASEVDRTSYRVATAIARANPTLEEHVEVRRQSDPLRVFAGILRPSDRVDVTMCNPPFFADRAEARSAARKKWKKLGRGGDRLSFRGRSTELETPGGETAFLHRMIRESEAFARQIPWFTTLVSKRGYLRAADNALRRIGVNEVRIIPLEQGNKRLRILAWSF
jgi:23S rRNA (adenine1618-N6)-methyltransferase